MEGFRHLLKVGGYLPLSFFLILISCRDVGGILKCKPSHEGGGTGEADEDTVFDFGEPVMFVTSHSQQFDPYSLIDLHRRTAILHEYLMVGYKEVPWRAGKVEQLEMVVYDGVKGISTDPDEEPDLVHQNLEKELYWRYFNSTGVYPWMAMKNATMERLHSFQPNLNVQNGSSNSSIDSEEGVNVKGISYTATLVEHEYFYEPQVPFDAIFEIPGHSRVLRKEKTIIQYQSFSLWRWKLSNKTANWTDITNMKVVTPCSRPWHKTVKHSDFARIENPCTKDMFLVYSVRRSADGKRNVFYLASPLIQFHLKETWFYDMGSEDQPWNSTVTAMVLTNDHFVVLAEDSLWVSQSLNDTSNKEHLEMSSSWEERPTLKYVESNPCEGYEETIACFHKHEEDEDEAEEAHSEHKLFYNPACYLYQIPNYKDYVIFTVKNQIGTELEFSVLYARRPYLEWRVLFSNVAYYRHYVKVNGSQAMKVYHIRDIIGIFFNHQSDQFDITIEVNEHALTNETAGHLDCKEEHDKGKPKREATETEKVGEEGEASKTENVGEGAEDTGKQNKSKSPHNIFIRFSLEEPISKGETYGKVMKESESRVRKEVDGVMGKGITDFVFPDNFEVDQVMVNGETQDVFFLGNQLWIAEAGSTFVYPALSGLKFGRGHVCVKEEKEGVELMPGRIKDCSFNHPDRTYMCLSHNRNLLLAGRIGSGYSPLITRIEDVIELHDASEVNAWSSEYFCEVIQEHSVFISGYSGKILMWFMHIPETAQEKTNEMLADPDKDSFCKNETYNEHVCNNIKRWKNHTCTSKLEGEPHFRMVSVNPLRLESRKQSTDGPLVPFLIDSNSAVLFEGIMPDGEHASDYTYFSEVNVGQKIYCNNYDLLKKDATNELEKNSCELFIRHIKSVENFLDGLRRCLYVTILKSIPMEPIPADLVVLVEPMSNKALIKIDDHINESPWAFQVKHIGMTLYLPGNFSILLAGFPQKGNMSLMEGYTTLYFHHQYRTIYYAYFSFLMDMSTPTFTEAHNKVANHTQEKEKERLRSINEEMKNERDVEVKMRERLEEMWKESEAYVEGENFFQGEVPNVTLREKVEADLLIIKDEERNEIFPAGTKRTPRVEPNKIPPEELVHGDVPYPNRTIWYLEESECDYIMTLTDNPLLKSHGGRISLDLHDKITFEVQMRGNTPIGQLMMYRPILVLTNSNPSILRVEKKEKLSGNPQSIRIMLSPTGLDRGVSVVSIRSIVSSLKCEHTTSVTFIVLCHRDAGRRLHINYPIPTCKPSEENGMYPRGWAQDQENCVKREELLSSEKSDIMRFWENMDRITYRTLPENYRPPSWDGSDIPTSKNIYNADPSKPMYNSWYKISRETFKYDRCEGKKSKAECDCSDNDRLIDDEHFTECKEKVFFTTRTGSGKPIRMSAEYDRLMRDEQQDMELFSKKLNWSVTIEEVNGRTEWYVDTPPSPYLTMINERVDLSEGMRHYDMNDFSVGLLGTGLFHFKVTLGRFESFDETTEYFLVYVKTEDFNHLHLFMIILGTIIFCMTLVFLGFLAARKRLSGMLPIQPESNKRKLKLM